MNCALAMLSVTQGNRESKDFSPLIAVPGGAISGNLGFSQDFLRYVPAGRCAIRT
jgi:hypothetical protein